MFVNKKFFKKIQNVGGTLNGGTNKDGTVYYEQILLQLNRALRNLVWAGCFQQ